MTMQQAISAPELIVLNTLARLGKKLDEDFSFQSKFFGGRAEKGGLVIDFLFFDPPDLAINVQGIYYHYEQGAGVIQRDIIARELLAMEGTTLIFIDDDDLERDPVYYVREALAYRDHSKLGRA